MKYSAIIADDDLQHLSAVKKIIADNFSRIDVIAVVSAVTDFVATINTNLPDIIILDSSLDQEDTFELIAQFIKVPLIIFVTADKKHAYQAFQFNAVDYLLKPVDTVSLVAALSKAVMKLDCINNICYVPLKLKILVVSSLTQHDIIKIDEIISISSEGRCTVFVTVDNQKIVSYKNLSEYDFLVVNHPCFFKISRSNIINFKFLKKVIKGSGLYCELSNGDKLPVSRRRTNDFKVLLNTFQ
ncbi:MAG: LytR/AlgR family response regulator transcription factor [Flavobacterium sp.]